MTKQSLLAGAGPGASFKLVAGLERNDRVPLMTARSAPPHETETDYDEAQRNWVLTSVAWVAEFIVPVLTSFQFCVCEERLKRDLRANTPILETFGKLIVRQLESFAFVNSWVAFGRLVERRIRVPSEQTKS